MKFFFFERDRDGPSRVGRIRPGRKTGRLPQSSWLLRRGRPPGGRSAGFLPLDNAAHTSWVCLAVNVTPAPSILAGQEICFLEV